MRLAGSREGTALVLFFPEAAHQSGLPQEMPGCGGKVALSRRKDAEQKQRLKAGKWRDVTLVTGKTRVKACENLLHRKLRKLLDFLPVV